MTAADLIALADKLAAFDAKINGVAASDMAPSSQATALALLVSLRWSAVRDAITALRICAMDKQS